MIRALCWRIFRATPAEVWYAIKRGGRYSPAVQGRLRSLDALDIAMAAPPRCEERTDAALRCERIAGHDGAHDFGEGS